LSRNVLNDLVRYYPGWDQPFGKHGFQGDLLSSFALRGYPHDSIAGRSALDPVLAVLNDAAR